MDAITTALWSAGTLYTIIFVSLMASLNIILKKYLSTVTMVSLFWINLFAYMGYLVYYFFKKFYFRGDVYAVEELIHEYTFYNAPLYIILALGILCSLIMFNKLIQKYEISVIIGFSQVSLLIASLGIILFGGPYSWPSLLGLFIVFLGALIVPLKNFSLTNPKAAFSSLSPTFMYEILIYALLLANERIINFLLTQKTATTQSILDSLSHVFPFSFQNLYFLNIGSLFFITLVLFIYLQSQKEYKGTLISTLKNNFWPILAAGIVNLSAIFTFQMAFYYMTDKLVLGALAKLCVPIMITLGYIILNEKITWEKVVGSAIIVFGGAIVLFL